MIVLLALLLVLTPCTNALTNPQTVDAEFRNAIRGCNKMAAAWIRAAFHDCGTFSKGDNSGGCDGSLQFEKNRPESSGIEESIDFFSNISRRFGVSFADAAVYGGIVAVKECGGPDIPFKFGRTDVTQANAEGRLPGASISGQEIKTMFMNRMGFSLEETVALIGGGHCIGRVRSTKARTVQEGSLDATENKFDNVFFQNVLSPSPPNGVSRIPSDGNMAADAEMKPIVEKFARDNSAFFSAFVSAYTKMGEFGAKFNPNQNGTQPNGNQNNSTSPGGAPGTQTGGSNGTSSAGSSGTQADADNGNNSGALSGARNGANPGTSSESTEGPNDGNNPGGTPGNQVGATNVTTPGGGNGTQARRNGTAPGAAGRSFGNPSTDGSSFLAEIGAFLLMFAPLVWN